MTLEEFYNSLINEDLFQLALGISQIEYNLLNEKFSETKKQDRTQSTPKDYRLLILILIKQFSLSDENIKRIFLPNATTSAVLNTFKTKVMPRLNIALYELPEIAHKLNQYSPFIIDPSSVKYENSADFFNAIILSIQQSKRNDLVWTLKPRELNPEWLNTYADKFVDRKKKTGQRGFVQMAINLLYDMESLKQLSDYQVMHFTSVLNLHVHHASFSPTPGYGKAQEREISHPLLYSRSQGMHVHGRFFKQLTSSNQKLQCLLPRNQQLNRVFGYEVKSSFVKNLGNYNFDGYIVKEFEKSAYFALLYAYSGLRTNAYKFTVEGIKTYLTSHTPQQLFTLLNLGYTGNSFKISPSILQNKNLYIHDEVKKLKDKLQGTPYYSNLYLALTHFRRANAQKIYQLSRQSKLANIEVLHDLDTNCLDIQFYPKKITAEQENANYSEGITNVIICFFTGLLNYHLFSAGLEIKVHRRQSFAFNRMTITDTTNMCMRVSMGYEPETFIPIFIKTLKTLDNILTNFNFLDKKDNKLAGGFEIVEKPRGKQATDNTGIQFLKFMRSTPNILKAVDNAETYLHACISQNDFYHAAFQMYINYIVDPSSINLPNPIFKFVPEIPEDEKSSTDNVLVVGFINNVLKYTLDRMEMSRLVVNQPESIYLYSYVMSKLIKLCHKANFWINHHTKYLSSHVYAKSLLLVEDLIEMLIVLDSLCIASHNNRVDPANYLEKLTQIDKSYTSSALELTPNQSIDVFYTDSGQQALTASIVCTVMQIFDPTQFDSLSTFIYPFGKCYFELFKNIKDNLDITLSNTFERAQFVLVDIRQIAEFQKVYTAASKSQIVVIDCTHNPCLNDGLLKSVTKQLLNDNRHIVLVESMLKHEQLGLDKFQAGKLMVLSPTGKPLKNNVRDELLSITEAAMHPVIASYFTMINEICRDKVDLPASIAAVGLFKDAPISAATQQLLTVPAIKK